MDHSLEVMNSVLFGAGLFRSLSRGELNKDDAVEKIKGLSSDLNEQAARYLLERILEMPNAPS